MHNQQPKPHTRNASFPAVHEFLRHELLTEAMALMHVPPSESLVFERQRETVRTLDALLKRFEEEFAS